MGHLKPSINIFYRWWNISNSLFKLLILLLL